jgi:hypothetical protein
VQVSVHVLDGAPSEEGHAMTTYTDGLITGLMIGILIGAIFFAFATALVFWLAEKVGAWRQGS